MSQFLVVNAYSAGMCSCLAVTFLFCTLNWIRLSLRLLFAMKDEQVRTTKQHFMAHSSELESTMVLTTSTMHHCSLSQHQIFQMASIVTAELASVASYASKAQFGRQIKLLKMNREVGLVEVKVSAS